MNHSEPVAAAIRKFLAQHSSTNSTFLIALSGGADSVALLHALCEQVPKDKTQAVYIDHQLHDISVEWADFNQQLCNALGVKFQTIPVNVGKSSSLEAEAREARYQALAGLLKPQQCLVTGHHQDDQAETLLLQLFRGAGPKGLSAMPSMSHFAEGCHARPLLNVSKDDILHYCQQHDLDYVEDPSNQDIKHRRNFIRRQVMPLLEQEWPQVKQTLSRASQLQSDAQSIIHSMASSDFNRCYTGEGLSIIELEKLSNERQREVVRYWFEDLHQEMPSQKVLEELLAQMLRSESDAQPSLEFFGGSIKRFQGVLSWVPETSFCDESIDGKEWDGRDDLLLSESVTVKQQWLQQQHPELVGKPLVVRTRQGGERVRKKNSGNTTSLKNYFQDMGIPSWQRDKVLLIVHNDEVRAVYHHHLSEKP